MGNYQDALTYLEQAYELRQKLNVPEDMAESLHNLAETNTKLGQYDKALEQYLKGDRNSPQYQTISAESLLSRTAWL